MFNGPSKCRATGYLSVITLGSDHWYTAPCPGPWVQASVTTNSFLDLSTISMLSSWFYLVYLIWYYYLSVNFVVWIVKQKIENKWNLFKKNMVVTKCKQDSKVTYSSLQASKWMKVSMAIFFPIVQKFFLLFWSFWHREKISVKSGPQKDFVGKTDKSFYKNLSDYPLKMSNSNP